MIAIIVTLFIGVILLLYGIMFFAHAVKRNAEIAAGFFYNVIGGIVAGIIVAMYLSFQGKLDEGVLVLLFGIAMFIIGFFVFMMRSAQNSNNQAMSFGKSKARLHDKEKNQS